MKRSCLTIFLVIIYSCFSYGGDPTIASMGTDSKYIRAQFAGNMGLFSVGVGHSFYNNRLFADLGYGYLPSSINGADVHTLAIKAVCNLFKYQINPVNPAFYLGTSLTYSITDNTYMKYPDYYPNGYYSPNAFHLNPFLGATVELPCFLPGLDAIWLYSEIGTVDYKIWYYIKNKTIDFDDIWNLCFGLTFHLKQNP
jgi:hypothetical protein